MSRRLFVRGRFVRRLACLSKRKQRFQRLPAWQAMDAKGEAFAYVVPKYPEVAKTRQPAAIHEGLN